VTALDSNVLIALWDPDPAVHRPVLETLDALQGRGGLMVSAPVFSELRAGPGRSDGVLDRFFANTGIAVDWTFTQAMWRAAGAAFQTHAARRAAARPRRILADFLIGAHAQQRCDRLYSLDTALYATAFPKLELVGAGRTVS